MSAPALHTAGADKRVSQGICLVSNVVGYNNTAARGNLNWYTPCFRSIGVNTIDINDINLSDGNAGVVGMGDSMQVVGPLGNASEMYFYWVKDMDMSGTVTTPYFWSDGEFNPVTVSFDEGDGIAIDNMNELEFSIMNAGEVSTNEVSFAAQENLNWSGNPFPVAINVNAIQLDDGEAGTVGMGDSMQIVGPLGNASEMYFYWVKDMDMSGTVTTPYFWSDGEFNPVTFNLEPGAGFAIDNMNGLTFDVKIKCEN